MQHGLRESTQSSGRPRGLVVLRDGGRLRLLRKHRNPYFETTRCHRYNRSFREFVGNSSQFLEPSRGKVRCRCQEIVPAAQRCKYLSCLALHVGKCVGTVSRMKKNNPPNVPFRANWEPAVDLSASRQSFGSRYNLTEVRTGLRAFDVFK